mmetsp:Transcript_31895/g.52618  ORF Transcript_31895/g.52618 Transcript_31895/m.52618 type:complete len:335 (-) Transcript_31895:13-1017(-)
MAIRSNRSIVVLLLQVQVLLVLIAATTQAMSPQGIHTIRSPGQGPLCVLVHGLDSHSGTWSSSVMRADGESAASSSSLSSPCLAIDQRGCGLSEDLNDDTFSQDALVDDLYEIISKEPTAGQQPCILVGHSLGGRIALAYAAKYPETLAAVVVEDMDIEPRPSSSSPVPIPDFNSVDGDRQLFQRRAASKNEMTTILSEQYNYSPDRIEGWWQEGRLVIEEKDDNSVWSNVNPDFRRLCYQHVLSTENGRRDCQTIAANSPSLQCHVMVAGSDGTVCFLESIAEMKKILGDQLTVHSYPEAGHSIHSSAKEKFLETMERIIESAGSSTDSGNQL